MHKKHQADSIILKKSMKIILEMDSPLKTITLNTSSKSFFFRYKGSIPRKANSSNLVPLFEFHVKINHKLNIDFTLQDFRKVDLKAFFKLKD